MNRGKAAVDEKVRANRLIGPAGVLATACGQRGPDATREAPAVIAVGINWQLARVRPGRLGVAERPAVPKKPGNCRGEGGGLS